MTCQDPAQVRTGHQVSGSPESPPYPFSALAPPSFPSRSGTSISIDCRSGGSLTVDSYAYRWTSEGILNRRCRGQLITFDMLPDDVLLEIFDFYPKDGYFKRKEGWITLTHVCRRWRSVVFQSPHRLNLHLICTPYTRARDTLDIWPPLPLISDEYNEGYDYKYDELQDNTIAALEHNDRVCQIDLTLMPSELKSITDSAAMQKPFPELTDLQLRMLEEDDGPEPILPDSFLARTAPRLRLLHLYEVPYPGIPKLLLSTTHLVHLDLDNIPRSGYIPPAAMVTGLSALTSLEFLRLHFRSPRPRPALVESRRQTPPPLTRSILSSLTGIRFKGVSEYLEEILTRIDAPRVKNLDITFFNQIIFDTPQLFQFISQKPTLITPEEGRITFYFRAIIAKFRSRTSDFGELKVEIPCTPSEWQLSSLNQVCTSSLPPVSTLENLYISEGRGYPPCWQDDVENTLWLGLLRSFVAVKNLYLSEEFVHRIAPALQELVGGRTTEVLPTLENIFLEGFQPSGPLHEGIEKFVSARRLTSHPVAVTPLDKERHWETFLF